MKVLLGGPDSCRCGSNCPQVDTLDGMPHSPHADEEPLLRIAARRVVRRARAQATTPALGRFLLFHASGAAGDALIALALAGSLFFQVPETEARGRVALYLALTVAPFAIVAPFLARVLDRHRGSMRLAMVVAALGRGVLAWLLSTRLDSALLFPIAFGILVLSRATLVVRGALLPSIAPDEGSFVNANASISKAGAAAGMIALVPGIILARWISERSELLLTAVVYLAGVLPALRLPSPRGRRPLEEQHEARRALRSVSFRQAVVIAAGMRFLVGFLVFHLAFALRREDSGAVGLGLLVGAAAIGTLGGAFLAPRLRRGLKEEGMLFATMAIAAIAGLLVGNWFSVRSAGVLVFVFGAASGAAKVAFDSLVQKGTSEAGRGFAFARYESLLQIAWVLGGLVPLLFAIPSGVGVAAAGVVASLLSILYVLGRRRARRTLVP
ncbi:MAG: MFS transporter [Actinomycetota bacterium]|nr:MFS transporter [Actinomycetota bacterium]